MKQVLYLVAFLEVNCVEHINIYTSITCISDVNCNDVMIKIHKFELGAATAMQNFLALIYEKKLYFEMSGLCKHLLMIQMF